MIRSGADVNDKDKVSTLPIPISDILPSHYSNYYVIYLIFYEQSVILDLVIYIMNGDVLVRDMILPSVLQIHHTVSFTHLLMFLILHVFSRVGKRLLTPQRQMT